ncbi:targeting protein for Xklp2 [Parasteatoda tepidariorum]|uniref:targeting protein for Xklp2 n=1 Tax=Parasteatoda tepidariorum TaxID=114398 RepID=UPI00077FD2FD|nr:targeting protein for Xklp2 [Parasteatoda tepidariorum]
MDLDDINCPQFIRFSTESFQNSLLNYDQSDSDMSAESMNQELEGDLTLAEDEASLVEPSEEEFPVHTRTTRSGASKRKTDVTIPKPFHFQTNNRLKNKDAVISVKEEKDFASQLRQHATTQASHAATCGVTKVKAFNLTESKSKKEEGSYVPLAEQIRKFQKTPERYHSSANKEFQPQKHWSPPKLRPRTPNLRAVKRHRTIYTLSREQEEEKQLEEIKAYEFHAHPIDPRVYKPDIIVKEKEKKSTKPMNFDLKTSQRAAAVDQSIYKESNTSYEFKARPVPKSILLGPTGLGEKPEIKITEPISPAFCTRKRVEKRKLLEEQDDKTSAKKGKITESSKPKENRTKKSKQKPKLVRPVPTQIKPFSFDDADKKRFTLKDKKIREEIEKENKPYIFKAQLLPDPNVSGLPKVQKKPATEPQPFNFVLDTRNLTRDTSCSFKENSISFKANPATVLKKEPFVPEKEHKHTAEFKEFELSTGRRASERLKLQIQKEAEEQENEKIRLARQALEEEKERKEILRLRQELVHKANPVRQYKVVEIKHSEKQLTEPKSPQFETNKRLKVRNKD